MRFEKLDMQNFRGFAARDFTFAPGFNVLVGENGAGKTTTLEALALGIDGLVGLDDPHRPSFRPIEHFVRRDVREVNGATTVESVYPARVTWTLVHDSRRFQGELTVASRNGAQSPYATTTFSEASPLKALGDSVRRGVDVSLPVFAFYSTGRLWTAPTLERDETLAPGSRFLGYEDWHSPDARVRRWVTWFKTQQLIALQEGVEPVHLTTVRGAVAACVEHCVDIAYVVRLDALVLTFDDGRRVPFGELSDGQRGMCALVGDLAHRAVELNPHLGPQAPAETSGVALACTQFHATATVDGPAVPRYGHGGWTRSSTLRPRWMDPQFHGTGTADCQCRAVPPALRENSPLYPRRGTASFVYCTRSVELRTRALTRCSASNTAYHGVPAVPAA